MMRRVLMALACCAALTQAAIYVQLTADSTGLMILNRDSDTILTLDDSAYHAIYADSAGYAPMPDSVMYADSSGYTVGIDSAWLYAATTDSFDGGGKLKATALSVSSGMVNKITHTAGSIFTIGGNAAVDSNLTARSFTLFGNKIDSLTVAADTTLITFFIKGKKFSITAGP